MNADKEILKCLGARIRAARTDAGLSQEGLALRAGLDRTYVGGVERGERNISIINLSRIAAALQKPVSALVTGIEGAPEAASGR